MAPMASSDPEVKTCSKTYLNNYETLKKQYDDLLAKQLQTKFEAATYKRGLDTVEAQLVTYRKNEVLFSEEVVVFKREVGIKQYEINMLKTEFKKVKQEKDGIEFKIEKSNKASKDLDQLLEIQITDKSKKSLGYSAVPPPHPLIYNRPNKLDLSYSGLDEFKEPEFKGYGPKNSKKESNVVCEKESDNSKENSNKSLVKEQESQVKSSFVEGCGSNTSKNVSEVEPKKVRKNNNALIIEDWVSDDEEQDESMTKPEKKTVIPTAAKIEKPVKRSVRYAEMYRSQRPRGNQRNWNDQRNWNGQKSNQLGSEFVMYNKACFNCGSFKHVQKNCTYHQKKKVVSGNNYNMVGNYYYAKTSHHRTYKNVTPRAFLLRTGLKPLSTAKHFNHKVNTVRPRIVNTARSYRTPVNTVRPKVVNTARQNRTSVNVTRTNGFNASKPQHDDKGFVDSGCSRHMTGNIAYLSDFKQFDGGYVAFGGGAYGGKISGKGTLKTANLDFEDVYFVNELKFNLFSVSQMCDKKNYVLFTDTECLVLSPNFKLPDENQILLKVPRKDNMYSFDMKNIVPKESLTCLVAKATLDESMLWHRRLGHINFKNINKLVKDNLVRGLPTKRFENDQTCVACLKGKQHKASCKSKVLNPITKPLFMLHMDLFGPTFVSSLMHKKYCLVVTDDYSRFTWVFFLTTKDETKFKNKVMDDFCREKGIKREYSVARTPQQNGVAERRNRTLIEAARTMLADSKLPTTFWAEAVSTACYVQSIGTVSNNSVETANTKVSDDSSSKDVNTVRQQVNTASPDVNTGSPELNVVGPSVSTASPTEEDSTEEEPKIEPTSIAKALSDSSWVEATHEELLAFLYGTIEEEVYVTQPLGFKDPDYPDKVYKIRPLVTISKKEIFWLSTVYVDDIIFVKTNKELCTGFEKLMKDKFQMSSMGELTFFLGLQVQQKEDGIFISQDKYVAKILKKFNYSDVKSASTPVDLEKPLVKDGDADDVDVHLYRSMIGSLMYLTASRPDIMFAVCACARFQVTPKTSHLLAVKRIFRYLKGKPTLGLWYSRDSPFELVAYTDSDYAGATLDRKSTTGGCQFLGNRLISWQCKKQTVVATSTTEAEYMAAASCCGQAENYYNQANVNAVKMTWAPKLQLIKTHLGISKEVGTPRYLSLVVPLTKVGDEAVHKELGDRMERAATNASSLEAELKLVLSVLVYAVKRILMLPVQVSAVEVSGVRQIQALVDKKRVIVTESSIRRDLHLDDAEGTNCLPTATIFEELARMGAKSTAWNEFSSSMASLIICLATNQKFNLSKYIFDAMVKHLDRGVKFLLYPRFLQVFINQQLGNMSTHKKIFVNPFHTKKVFANMKRAGKDFSRRITPLFDTMMVQPVEEMGEDSDHPTDSTPIPIIDQPSSSSQPKKDKSSKKA
ncbi:putative ribonuclease H-like domain-containing protein [Tanacetum coccineum]